MCEKKALSVFLNKREGEKYSVETYGHKVDCIMVSRPFCASVTKTPNAEAVNKSLFMTDGKSMKVGAKGVKFRSKKLH